MLDLYIRSQSSPVHADRAGDRVDIAFPTRRSKDETNLTPAPGSTKYGFRVLICSRTCVLIGALSSVQPDNIVSVFRWNDLRSIIPPSPLTIVGERTEAIVCPSHPEACNETGLAPGINVKTSPRVTTTAMALPIT